MEKTIDKNSKIHRTKALSKRGTEENFLNLINKSYLKLRASIISTDEKLKALPMKT